MDYCCVVGNLVDCKNTKDYNTQVVTEIKGKMITNPDWQKLYTN